MVYREEFPDAAPATGAVEIEIMAYFPVPKSYSKKKHQQALTGILHKTTKPDLDNIQKAIQDGLNGVAFVDDSQIDRIKAYKGFSDSPRADIKITEWSDEE